AELIAAAFLERMRDAGIFVELDAGEIGVIVDGDLLAFVVEDSPDGVNRRAEALRANFKHQRLVLLRFKPEPFRPAIARRSDNRNRRRDRLAALMQGRGIDQESS